MCVCVCEVYAVYVVYEKEKRCEKRCEKAKRRGERVEGYREGTTKGFCPEDNRLDTPFAGGGQ